MIKYMRRLNLEVGLLNGRPRRVTAKQNDANSRYLNILLTANGRPLPIDEDSTVKIRGKLPGDYEFEETGTVDPDGTVTLQLSDNMLKIPGEFLADLAVTGSEGEQLSSASFMVRVIAGPADSSTGGDSLPSATETTLGGVKVGKGLKVNEDGTLYVDGEYVATSDDLVNEEEVQEEVKKILENEGDN